MKQFFLMTLMAFLVTSCSAQNRKSPHETVSNDQMSVSYGRPSAKGRDIFGGLEKYGKVWRCGADEATEITFKQDMNFGGKPVKAGTYTMFVIPQEKEWTIILNSELKQWGAYNYDKIKDKNVLETTVPTMATGSTVEQLTITTGTSDLSIAWDDTMVKIPVSK